MTFALHDPPRRVVSAADYRAAIACGPLLPRVLDRLLGALAARADLSVDRLNDLAMVGDAVSAAAAGNVANGQLDVIATPDRGRARSHLRPLRARAAQRASDAPAACRAAATCSSAVAKQVEVVQDGDVRAPHPAHRALARTDERGAHSVDASPGRWLVDLADRRAQLGQRAAQQARDVHLRDADAGRDLRLRQAFLEAHRDDLALALGEARRVRRPAACWRRPGRTRAPRSARRSRRPCGRPRRSAAPAPSARSRCGCASSTASGETSRYSASSAVVGASPCSALHWSIVALTRTRSSCTERGTCTAHARSR